MNLEPAVKPTPTAYRWRRMRTEQAERIVKLTLDRNLAEWLRMHCAGDYGVAWYGRLGVLYERKYSEIV